MNYFTSATLTINHDGEKIAAAWSVMGIPTFTSFNSLEELNKAVDSWNYYNRADYGTMQFYTA